MHCTFKGNNGSIIILQNKEDVNKQIYINASHVSSIIDSTSEDNRIFLLSLHINDNTYGVICSNYLNKESVLNKLINLISSAN
jgi:hypothetical protein